MPGLENISFQTTEAVFDFIDKNIGDDKIDKGIYETLIRRGKQITAKYKMSRYILFSLSGYTEWFDNLSDEKVILLTLDSLYE